uniref:Uncharacterized protein n=1 Tax=Ixodes ricinus TaxID=34613 RepID=A0A090XD92_IXORI
MAVSLGVEFADIYDYRSQRSNVLQSKEAIQPSGSGCRKLRRSAAFMNLKKFQSKYLHLRFPCATESLKTCDMPTANQVLRYGTPYTYKYKNEVISPATRNINSKLYTACIDDKFINGTYESYYYWGGEDLSFRFPSGEKKIPVHVEQTGEYYQNETKHTHYIFKNIPWYQKGSVIYRRYVSGTSIHALHKTHDPSCNSCHAKLV